MSNQNLIYHLYQESICTLSFRLVVDAYRCINNLSNFLLKYIDYIDVVINVLFVSQIVKLRVNGVVFIKLG